MSDTEHTLSDDDLLRLYMSGYFSGAGTVIEAYGVPHEEALDIARDLVRRMMADPAARETVLDLHRAGGGGVQLPMVRTDKGGTP